MEGQSGASVAAVFDLTNDVLRLNLFYGLLILFAVIVPTVMWEEDNDLMAKIVEYPSVESSSVLFSLEQRDAEETPDQLWGWVTRDYNNSEEWQETYENETTFDCAPATLSPKNLEVCIHFIKNY